MINRTALKDLIEWKSDSHRKPLVLRGARQVGKTELVRELSKSFSAFIELNFDETPEKASYFKNNDISSLVQYIEVDAGKKLIPNDSLIFLDEIQAAPEALAMLRYFYEKRPDIHVIAAGSLLEFLLQENDGSMPVGRVDYYFLGPLSFEEFLGAQNEDLLLKFLESFELSKDLPEALHQKFMKFHQIYSIVGGMPEATARWIETEDFSKVQKVHMSILQTYEDDFSKYRRRIDPELLRKVMKKVPVLVGEKVKYVNIDSDKNSGQINNAIKALASAKVISCAFHSDGNGVPLGAEINEKRFKAIFLDIGLYSSSLSLNLNEIHQAKDILFVNNGAFAEQYVGQELLLSWPYWVKPELFYWHRDARGSNAELDYLFQHGREVIPVEVKAGKTGSLRSLHTFMASKKKPKALRFNADTPSLVKVSTEINKVGKAEYDLLSLPLYMTGQVRRLLDDMGHSN